MISPKAMNATTSTRIGRESFLPQIGRLILTLLLLFSGVRKADAEIGSLEPSMGTSDTDLIILVHGWNPSHKEDMYAFGSGSDGWFWNLHQALLNKTAGSEWRVLKYRWEKDASTGGKFDGNYSLNPFNNYLTIQGYNNATVAASNADYQGIQLYYQLKQNPKLRKVHFVCHSAGSWVARRAAEHLLEHNPYLIVQITLLDPFVPGQPGGIVTPLTTPKMSAIASVGQQQRIFRLENYFCNDASDFVSGGPTNTTSQIFSWRVRDTQLNLAYSGGSIVLPDPWVYGGAANGHHEPVRFMVDSVTATAGGTIPVRQVHAPWPGGFSEYGFYRSMFYESFRFPRFTTQPSYSAGTISATVNNSTGVSYQWFRNGSSTPIPDSNTTSLAVTPPTSGSDRYVLRAWKTSDPHLQAFSQEVVVAAVNAPQPRIESITPRYLTGKPAPQTSRITINGANFTATSRLEFNDGVNSPYTNRVPATWSPTTLTYDVAVGLEAANWTVKVVDGGVSSPPYAFYVVPPTGGKTLSGLAIEGPTTVNSGGTAQFKAKAHYSDGSSSYVSASWSENSSSASISSSGLLSASTVSSNREVTVSATYTEGTETRNASSVVTIVTSSGSGGSETNNVIVNGNFESGRTPWSPVGYADVAALSYPRTGSWYAYIGNTNNATGAISQFFPISSNMTDAVLEFYLNVSSDETTTTTVFDQMTVSLATQYDQHVADIATFSNLDKRTPGSYVKKSYNIKNIINAYKGQSLFLVFSGTTDASLQTTFRIDDVRLDMTTSTPVSLVDLRIDGDSAVAENGFFAYRAMAVFSDGTTQLVSPNSWSENSSVSTINSSGYFYTSSASTQTTVTVSTSYTFNGVTRNASKQVTVFPLSSPPVLDRLTIEGPGWVDEGSYINLVGKAIFSNGSVQTVTPTWSLSSSWATINSNGRVTGNQVTGDRTVTVGASYSLSGITRTASHEVMIIDGDATPSLDRIEIIGPSTLPEGTQEPYDALAHFTDGSSRYVNPTWSENSSSATITSYGLLGASYVSTNTTVTISASYTSDGIQRSATKSVTILDVPDVFSPALAITSPSSGSVSASQVVTIIGVATDSGYGNNGIASVMVNGAPASGGSVSGGGFANWSKEVTLVEGSNLIEVVATDGASNVSTKSIQVIWNPAVLMPKLVISRVAGEVELVWPVGWENWKLESTENLADPASWREVTATPTTENGVKKIRDAVSGPMRFYRLRFDSADQ
jgi:hypothetical protein